MKIGVVVGSASGKGSAQKVLVIHPHEVQQDPQMRALIEQPIKDNILHLAEQCERAGVLLVMENSPKGVGRTPEGLLAYIASLGAPTIRPAVDTTESCESDIDPAEFIRKARPAHLHLSDHASEKKHIPAGEGDTNWRSVAAALGTFDYRGYYTLEPLYRYYLDTPEEKLARAYAFISGLIGD
jgi:sugar phosphate isomerase/epimerase